MCANKRWLLSILVIAFTLVVSGRCADGSAGALSRKRPAKAMFGPGCPQVVSHCARPSDTPNYRGYYVGGGAACMASRDLRTRALGAGTTAAYSENRRPEMVARAHAQGGGGAYATDHK